MDHLGLGGLQFLNEVVASLLKFWPEILILLLLYLGQLLLIVQGADQSEAVQVSEEVLDAPSDGILDEGILSYGSLVLLQSLLKIRFRSKVLEIESEISQNPNERREELGKFHAGLLLSIVSDFHLLC